VNTSATEILARLDIAQAYRDMGLKFNGQSPNSDGWLSVHAAGRENKNPSASINVRTGRYKDHTTGESLSLFDFAAKYGGHGDWRKARAFFADKVELRNGASGKNNGRGRPSGNGQGDGAPLADADTLHAAYSALLDGLTLSDDHRANLRARGLSDEQIDARRYRSYPLDGRDRARWLILAAIGPKANGVPGMGQRNRSLYGPEGLLIPCHDTQGRIVGISIRRDSADAGSRYVWLSSKKHGGPSPGAPCHVPVGIPQPSPRARVTEGALKGDIAYSLSGLPTIGVAGVGNLKTLVDVLKQLGAETVVLSFDADAAENPAVARALCKAYKLLVAAGFQVEMERWAPEDGKGIDDLLAAGKVPELLTGDAVAAEIERIAQQAGAGEPTANDADDEPGTIKLLADAIQRDNHFARDAGGRLYRYTNGVFRPGAENFVKAEVKRLCVEWAQTKKWNSRLASEVVEFLRVDSPELPDRPPIDLINVQNGMVFIQDGTVLPHDPRFLSAVQVPVKFDPVATCPNIESFVRTSFPPDAYNLAWEIAGVLMVPMTWLQKVILLLGGGGNGKSTYLALVVRFLGRHNVATIPLHRLEVDKFSVSRLVGKLANICADLPSEHLAGTSTFKALTGGDILPAEYKFKDSFDLDPFARLVFSANHPPRSADSSSAFFRRWTVIPFDRSFDDTAEEIPRDILDARLQAPEELSGLLNKALDGLRRVQQQRRFSEPESVKAAWRDFHAITDPLAVWLDRYTIDDSDAVVIKHVLRVAYNAAVERDGRPAMTAKAFGQAIYKLRPNIDEKQRMIGHKLQWCYVGIGLVSNSADSHDSRDSRDSPLIPTTQRTREDDADMGIGEWGISAENPNRDNPVNPVNPVNPTDCLHEYQEQQDPDRPGWLKTTCPHCGKVLGSRPEKSK
jgi:putative DNA primase/helicase